MDPVPQTSVSPLKPSRFVSTTLRYFEPPPNSAPDQKWEFNVDNTGYGGNFEEAPKPSNIYDMRGQEKAAHVDATGFQPLTVPSDVSADFLLNSTNEEIKTVYYPECEKLLKDQLNASRVVVFEHLVRRPYGDAVPETGQTPRPFQRVHIDQTPKAAHKRVERHVHLPQPYKRFQIINVWRPILHTVYDWPLAVCEFYSLDFENDLVPAIVNYPPPRPPGETYNVKHNPNHRWWFWSEMTPNDVLLLKCYDSASRALTTLKESKAEVLESELREVTGFTPHCAFHDVEGEKKSNEKRHSIEVRALVFYD